jgi:hypothetical protein
MKHFKILSVLAVVLLFSGCLDAFQHIRQDPSGKVEVFFKFTLQKGLFEMAAQMSGEEMDDEVFEAQFGEDFLSFEKDLPEGVEARVEKINNDLEFGMAVRFSYMEDEIDISAGKLEEVDFYPIRDPVGFHINFSGQEKGEGDDGDDEMAGVFLASAKYKIIVDKSYLKGAQQAWLEMPEETFPIEIIDLGPSFLLDLPMVFLFSEGRSTLFVR